MHDLGTGEARIHRHATNHKALRAGLETMGLEYIPDHSLTTLNAVHVPEGVDDALVRGRLLNEFGIEIGAGLGPFKGKAWRIGLMGHSSSQRNVVLLVSALEALLNEQGYSLAKGAALAAVSQTYQQAEKDA